MKLNIKALCFASGILWATAILILGVANMIWPPYGGAFLQIIASIYPGYHAVASVGSVIVGALYALVDGAIAGLLFGWLYNIFSSKK